MPVDLHELYRVSGEVGALRKWASRGPADRQRATAPARQALQNRFAETVDRLYPGLEPRERSRRIRTLRSLFFAEARMVALQRRRAEEQGETIDRSKERFGAPGRLSRLAVSEWGGE